MNHLVGGGSVASRGHLAAGTRPTPTAPEVRLTMAAARTQDGTERP